MHGPPKGHAVGRESAGGSSFCRLAQLFAPHSLDRAAAFLESRVWQQDLGPKAWTLSCCPAQGCTAGDVCICPPAAGTFAILSLMTGSVARAAGAGTPRGESERNPEGAAGRLAGWGSRGRGLRERGVDGERGPGEEPGGIPAEGPGKLGRGRGRDQLSAWVREGGGARGWFAPPLDGDSASSPPQLGMFVLQLGVLSTFLSEPVVKALTSGAALHVLLSQLPSLLGLSLSRQIGCFSLFKVGVEEERRRGF